MPAIVLSSSYNIKLKNSYTKILYLHAAYKQTFVFLAIQGLNSDYVVHVDVYGSVLFQHKFQRPVLTMGMLNIKEAIFLQTRRNVVSVLDLEKHQWRQYPYLFMREQSDQSAILTFAETSLLCIEEKGRYNDNRMKLTYFKYPLAINSMTKELKVYGCYESRDNEWTYQYKLVQGNQKSLMLWYKPKHDIQFEFRMFQIKDEKGQFRIFRYHNPISYDGIYDKIQTLVMNAWEARPNQYIFICVVGMDLKKEIENTNYLVDVQTAVEEDRVREVKFTFGPYQEQIFKSCNLGRFSLFKTFMVDNGQPVTTPSYYVDNQTEQVVAQEQWQWNNMQKYEIQGYTPGLLCEGIYDNGQVSEFFVSKKLVVYQRQLYTFLMVESKMDLCNQLMEDVLDYLT